MLKSPELGVREATMDELERSPNLIRGRYREEAERLGSWKEIAAYMGRDIRTIARWEKYEGLPIHRQLHWKSASVYAYRSELDEWRFKRDENAGRRRARRKAGFIAAVLAFAALLFAAGWLTRGAKVQTIAAVPLTGSPGFELQPSLSPDGKQVAYVWNGEAENNFDIYVRLVGAGPPLRLTQDAAEDYSPAWSPGGESIAFLRRTGTNRSAVFIVSALGGAERRLTELSCGAWSDWSRPGPFLTWTRDSRFLIVTGWRAPENTDRLFLVSAGTGEIRSLAPLPPGIMGDSAPALSARGDILAFSRRTSWGVSDLCLLPLSPGFTPAAEVKCLNTGSKWNASPVWAPDGRSLIFSTGTMDATYLARIDASRSGPAARLLGVGDYGSHPQIARTPGGRMRLVYTRHFESVNIWQHTAGDRSPSRRLISSPHWSYEPAYSPDGHRIAFISDRSGFGEIWAADADGRNLAQWTFLKQPRLGSPRWSPDGRRIAFTAPRDRGSSIHLVDAPGAAPVLVRGSEQCGYLAWAPDGRAIYFSSNRSGAAQIWKIAPEGGEAIQVTARGGRVPAISPGGGDLYYLRPGNHPGENHLYRVLPGGGDERKVLDFVDAYSVSRTGIAFKYYHPGGDPAGPFLQFYDFGTAATERLPETPKPLRYGVAISPDGRSIAYAQADYEVSELMLVENLR